MTEQQKRVSAERFVEKVLRETFKQNTNRETVESVAKKVSKAIPTAKKAQEQRLEAAE